MPEHTLMSRTLRSPVASPNPSAKAAVLGMERALSLGNVNKLFKFTTGHSKTNLVPQNMPVDNFLGRYFKEMAELDVLQPEEEFAAAQRIEVSELILWSHLLQYPQTLSLILAVLEKEEPSLKKDLLAFNKLARRISKRSRPATLKTFQSQTNKLADKIHRFDLDRHILDQVMNVITSLKAKNSSRIKIAVPLAKHLRTKSFLNFYQQALTMHIEAHRARNEFIKANLRLVVSIARRFNHGRMPLSDLIQEGNIGLIKAVERYDYRRGFRFSTYASWWIRHSINRALADKGRAVRLPVHMLDAYHKVVRNTNELTFKLGRTPTPEEISSTSGIAIEKVERLQGALLEQSYSLDRNVSDDDDRHFVEMIVDENIVSPTEKINEEVVTDEVQQLLFELKPIEADVLRKRYGLVGERELTLKEIGETYSLSRERIRQIQEQALGKLRRALQRRDML